MNLAFIFATLFLVLLNQQFVKSQLIDPCSLPVSKGGLICTGEFECNQFGTARILQSGCVCKPNVVGKKCDVCRKGYWGLNENGCKGI